MSSSSGVRYYGRNNNDNNTATANSNNTNRRNNNRISNYFNLRYLKRCVIGHERFHYDEIVNNWRFLETENRDITRVIDITFTNGTQTAIKLNQINNIIKYIITVTDNETNEETEIHAVESLLNNGRVVRFRFNGIQNTGGSKNAQKFYNDISTAMNQAVGN